MICYGVIMVSTMIVSNSGILLSFHRHHLFDKSLSTTYCRVAPRSPLDRGVIVPEIKFSSVGVLVVILGGVSIDFSSVLRYHIPFHCYT